jgi:hypothetical protein
MDEGGNATRRSWTIATLGVTLITLGFLAWSAALFLAFSSIRHDSLGHTLSLWAIYIGILPLALFPIGLALALIGMAAHRNTQFSLRIVFVLVMVIAVVLGIARLFEWHEVVGTISLFLFMFVIYGWAWVLTRVPDSKNG